VRLLQEVSHPHLQQLRTASSSGGNSSAGSRQWDQTHPVAGSGRGKDSPHSDGWSSAAVLVEVGDRVTPGMTVAIRRCRSGLGIGTSTG